MATQLFNLGRDVSLVVISPMGGEVQLSIVMGFDAKQETHAIRVRPLNGPTQAADLPDGWNGSIKLDRGSSAVDDLFSQIELGYWAGGNIGTGEVYQYVNEVDGSVSTYLFGGVTMKLSDSGSWKADSTVTQSIDFYASTRKRV